LYAELPELKGIKVFRINDAEAQAKRAEFLAQRQQTARGLSATAFS
jgi:hypothetical protein